MKYKVRIYGGKDNKLISDDIWYGNSIDNVKFWIDLAVKEIVEKLKYKNVHYEVEEYRPN